MPNKNPNFWESLIIVLSEYGFIMSITFILSYLRISYDQKERTLGQRLLESSIGSLLSLLAGMSFERFGLSEGWTYAAVGFIGVYGVDQIKSWGRKWAENKIQDRPQYPYEHRERIEHQEIDDNDL